MCCAQRRVLMPRHVWRRGAGLQPCGGGGCVRRHADVLGLARAQGGADHQAGRGRPHPASKGPALQASAVTCVVMLGAWGSGLPTRVRLCLHASRVISSHVVTSRWAGDMSMMGFYGHGFWCPEQACLHAAGEPGAATRQELRFLHDPDQAHGYCGAALSSNVIHFTKVCGSCGWLLHALHTHHGRECSLNKSLLHITAGACMCIASA